MKFFLFLTISLLANQAISADIIYYDSKNVGSSNFHVINSSQITFVEYDGEDKELNVNVTSRNPFSFKVKTSGRALEIVKKLYDKTDNDLIELEKS
jgi:hypothetical protein